MHAWYSGVSSVKPISWISDFKLGFVGDGVLSGGESMLNWILFWISFHCIVVVMGMGFPSACANADWLVRTNFLIGLVGTVGAVRFGLAVSATVANFQILSKTVLRLLLRWMNFSRESWLILCWTFPPFGGSFHVWVAFCV